MPSENPTTVILTKKAQEIKNRLAPAFGLKKMLSVGLELFDSLTDEEKIRKIAGTSKKSEDDSSEPRKKTLKDALDIIKKSAKIEHQRPGEVLQLMTKKEQVEFEKLLDVLAPGTGKAKNKKEG